MFKTGQRVRVNLPGDRLHGKVGDVYEPLGERCRIVHIDHEGPYTFCISALVEI